MLPTALNIILYYIILYYIILHYLYFVQATATLSRKIVRSGGASSDRIVCEGVLWCRLPQACTHTHTHTHAHKCARVRVCVCVSKTRVYVHVYASACLKYACTCVKKKTCVLSGIELLYLSMESWALTY